MRSRLPAVAPAAWLALVGFGGLEPVAQASAMPNMISICSASGPKLIEIPAPANPGKRDDCVKGCHALCQRKRAALQDSVDEED